MTGKRKRLMAEMRELADSGAAGQALQLIDKCFNSERDRTRAAAWRLLIRSRLNTAANTPARDWRQLVEVIDVPNHHSTVDDCVRIVLESADLSRGGGRMPLIRTVKSGDLLGPDDLAERHRDDLETFLMDTFSQYLKRHGTMLGGLDGGFKCVVKCWLNRVDAGGSIGPHYHPDSLVSAVYYPRLKVDSRGPAGPLEFMCYPVDMPPDDRVEKFRIAPVLGQMILFPSYFGHRVLENRTGEPRLSLAADLLPVI